MTDNTPALFWPRDLGPYESDLHSLLVAFRRAKSQQGQLEVVEKRLGRLPAYPNVREKKLRYRAYLQVLADLLRQRWQPEIRQGKLYLRPPHLNAKVKGEAEVQTLKQALRDSLMWERQAQFEKSAIQKFIRHMEQERPYNGHPVSIRSLFADGPTLASQLQAIVQLNKEVQLERIVTIIKPYLQLVKSGARCQFTGFYLQDIWRYFRYTWSTPYNPTPGRQMFYLVRDAAQPNHPVIGIAALGSSMVQLTVRDDAIGWTPKAVEKRIFSPDFEDAQAAEFAKMLHQTVHDVLSDLITADLVTADELVRPTPDTLNRLALIEKESREQRICLLKQQLEQERVGVPQGQLRLDSSLGSTDPSLIDSSVSSTQLPDLAQDALYRTKRASVLRQLLQARQALEGTTQSIETSEGLRAFWHTSAGQQAIKTLVRENKKRKVGINMMDIIVCGAVPPYNVLLGGKLVAMVLVSPQIIHDYQQKYVDYASTIASRMKGENVQRDPRLVFLGTTSLYSSGSSQYNRIVIPVPGQEQDKMSYIRYGLTEGYGSVHFSQETTSALTDLQESVQGARLINNRFGEGVNPKLRRMRTGLAAIGLPSADNFLRHRSQRIVYGLPLGQNSYAFLRGETTDPGYYFPVASETERTTATDYISRYWATRWLWSRIQTTKFVNQVAAFQPEHALLSREIRTSPGPQPTQRTMAL